jgi:hypothetical protein
MARPNAHIKNGELKKQPAPPLAGARPPVQCLKNLSCQEAIGPANSFTI